MTVYAAPGQPGCPVSFPSRYDNWIGGEWVAPAKGQYFENVSPVTGQPFIEVARSTAEDIDLALDAAHRAAPTWGRTSATERGNVLLQDRRPDRAEPRAARRRRDLGERQAGPRDPRRPTSRWRSTTSATSRARCGPRRAASPRSTRTRSPTTSTSRSASSARSSPGTSRS